VTKGRKAITFNELYAANKKEKANLIENKTKQTSEKARRYRRNCWLLFYLFIYVLYFIERKCHDGDEDAYFMRYIYNNNNNNNYNNNYNGTLTEQTKMSQDQARAVSRLRANTKTEKNDRSLFILHVRRFTRSHNFTFSF